MQLSLLSMGPKISREEGRLVARTSLMGFLSSLTLLHRTVIVDPMKQAISIRRRLFWFFTSRKKIPFERVQSIVYTYDDWNSNTAFGGSDDSKDCFAVKLKLWSDRLVHLFNFYGEGTFVNNSAFPDWFDWDEYRVDLSGTQESESRMFVDLLQKILNVPVTRQ